MSCENLMLLSVCGYLSAEYVNGALSWKTEQYQGSKSECEKIYITLKLSAPIHSSETSCFLILKLLCVTYHILLSVFYKSVFHSQACLYCQSTEGSNELVNSSPTL